MSPSIPSGLARAHQTPLQRLLSAIRDPQISAAVGGLVQRAQGALTGLDALDESLYERFKDGGRSVDDDTAPGLLVGALMNSTFHELKAFSAYCKSLRPVQAVTSGDDDFSFGDLEGAASAGSDLELGAGDIGALLDGIDEHPQQTEAQRFTALLEKVSSVEYGLTSQLTEMEERVRVSIAHWEISQAIEVLDDTKSSTSQGVFAVLSMVCQAFQPDTEPTSLAPGHLTVLDQALVVRQALAELARAVAGPHARLQREDAVQQPLALVELRTALSSFVASAAFPIMRPADRWQLNQFERKLKAQAPGAAKFTSEGLAKYLESLSAINQREVLILHDRRASANLREALAEAQQLALIRPELAVEPMQRALDSAFSLYGSSPEIDDVLAALRERPPRVSDPRGQTQALAMLGILVQVVRR